MKISKIKLLYMSLILINAEFAFGAYKFSDILHIITQNQKNIVTEVPSIQKLRETSTLEQAAQISSNETYTTMTSQKKIMQLSMFEGLSQQTVYNLIKNKNTTIVIVPGLLGEFIDTRAFEEIFSKNSKYKTEWNQLASKSNLTDVRLNLEKYAYENAPISELFDAASVDDEHGNILFKIILLKTRFGSLESVGGNQHIAQIFNRRINKYLQITNDQNLVFLGYSRGAPLALEMLSQAQSQHLSYLSKVSAMISYAGVLFGSALADITDDENTESGRIFSAIKELQENLQPSENTLLTPLKLSQNSFAISKFLAILTINMKFNFNELLNTARSGDIKTVASLVARIVTELGLKSLTDFNGHVYRAKMFIAEILTSVNELKSTHLIKWWQTHQIPQHVKYYAISAVMVDPEKNELEKEIYESKIGYNDTLDDHSLQDNRRTYEKASGFAMNDSQVAIHQSQFLPQVIAHLNKQNSQITTESLGLLETHHWGITLQTVNTMSDGTLNPFPREKVLISLAAFLNQ